MLTESVKPARGPHVDIVGLLLLMVAVGPVALAIVGSDAPGGTRTAT